MKANRYVPSGRIGSTAYLWLVVVDLLLVPLCAALYAMVIWYLPIAFFNPLIAYLFALGLTIIHNWLLVERGKVRDVKFASYSAYLAVAVFMYVQWAVWIALADGKLGLVEGSTFFLTHPIDLLKVMGTIYQTGTWSGLFDSGLMLAIVWVIEFLIIYFSFVPAVKEKVSMPFSDAADEWFTIKDLPKMQFIENQEAFVAELESGNFSALRKLSREKQETGSHSLLTLYFSPKEEYYVNIVNNKATRPNESASKYTGLRLFKYLGIDRDTGKQLHGALSGKSLVLSDNDFKLPLYKKLAFSETDIRRGESMYSNLRKGNVLYRLSRVYTIWHPRIGNKSPFELYGAVPNPMKVAVINMAQDEGAEYRGDLAENLFHSTNGVASEEPQEFYELTSAWLDKEPNPGIRSRLTTTLLMYTSVSEDARKHLLDLVRIDKGISTDVAQGLEYVGFLDAAYRKEIAAAVGIPFDENSGSEDDVSEQPIRYKCRPGYGSSDLLIEILDASDEFFLQYFLKAVKKINPRSESEPSIEDMHQMLSDNEVTWEGTSDAGDFSFSQDNYGTAFIHAENNEKAILAIDAILKANPRFIRLDVDPDDYKKTT